LSPQALINAWYIKNPPWLQFDREKNNAGELLENASQIEDLVREVLQLRMALIPYLYAAFAQYHFQGKPPFRALVLDYPHDSATYNIDDQYMMGDDVLVAPMLAGETQRRVYLPAGEWFSFDGTRRFDGNQVHVIDAPLRHIPIFVRAGTILPLAAPLDSITADTVFEITPRAYGPVGALRAASLFEDDGISLAFRQGDYAHVTIHPDQAVTRTGQSQRQRYRIVGWENLQ
jgi:alpha-D-xyloside xylohydrolase